MSELAKRNNYMGWYVGVHYDYEEKPDIEFGPMSKSAAVKKARELDKDYGSDNPYESPVWMMSGRAMLAHYAEQAEKAAGWDASP